MSLCTQLRLRLGGSRSLAAIADRRDDSRARL